MAEIINNTDPESNPRLKEIYQILLLAGYFRIRINSLKPFDKIIGGLAWAITCSNFDVDVEYNDEMQIGQKIKVSEKICDALKKMKCPYNIQPFQLQGLDLNNIYPVVQWLIKFVYETRQYRQKFNTQLSNFLGGNILKFPEQKLQEAAQNIQLQNKRSTKNAFIKNTSRKDPLRVYSTLIQFGDVTSTITYNKLCAIITGKVNKTDLNKEKGVKGKESKPENKNDPKSQQSTQQTQQQGGKAADKNQFNIASYLFNIEQAKQSVETEKIIQTVGNQQKNNFKKLERKMSFSGAELEKLVTQNRQKIEQALQNKQDEQQSPEAQLNKLIKIENETFQNQKQLLIQKIKSLERVENVIRSKVEDIFNKSEQINQIYEAQQSKLKQLQQQKKEIEAQIKQKANMNDLKTKELEKLVEERLKLKTQKIEKKKAAKAKFQELNKIKAKVIQNIPQVDEEVFNKMLEQTKIKKKIYDEKFLEFTMINQQLAVIQRKAQNFTSATEIAQYHQRFLELFESINIQIEKKRDLYNQINHLESIKSMVLNYVEVMRTFKENYANSKSKDDKKQFIENLKQVYKALETNKLNSENMNKKIIQSRDRNFQQYTQLIKLERQYFNLLKQLKIEYELAQQDSKY